MNIILKGDLEYGNDISTVQRRLWAWLARTGLFQWTSVEPRTKPIVSTNENGASIYVQYYARYYNGELPTVKNAPEAHKYKLTYRPTGFSKRGLNEWSCDVYDIRDLHISEPVEWYVPESIEKGDYLTEYIRYPW